MTENPQTDAEPDVDADEKVPAPQPGRRLRRWLFWLRAAYVVCLMPFIFAAAAAVMIVDRDIAAPSWIKQRIEARAEEALDGGQLRFGAISLRIGRDLHPTVRLIDTQLRDQSGLVITRVPVVEGLILPRGLILQQDVLLQDIRLIGAQVNLRRAADGSVAVALAAGAGDVGQARSLPELLDLVDQLFERPALEALETVRTDGLIVNFDDARAGRSWIVDGGTVVLDLQDEETALRGDFSVLSGRAGVTTVNLSYSSPRGSRAAQLALNIKDAVASDIAAQSPALSWLRDVEAPITAALRTELDEQGALGPLSATLEIGQGVLQPNPASAPIQFDQAKAYLTYDPVRDSIAFSQIDLQTEWGTLRANGTAYLREFQNGLPRALLTQFQFEDVTLNPMALYDTAPLVPSVEVDLRLRLDPFRIDIGQVVIEDGATRITSRGSLAATDAGWQVAVDAAVSDISPELLLSFWPKSVKPGTRNWVSNNVIDARIFNGNIGLRIEPDRPTTFAAGFEFADATVRFMRHMPLITDADGVVSFIDSAFVVAVDKGIVAAPQGGLMQLAGSVFSIPDVRIRPVPAVFAMNIESSITAALSILNQRPLEYLDKANLPVTLADGRAQVTGTVDWPLKPGTTSDDVTFDVSADLRSVRSGLIPGRRLVAPRLKVLVDRAGLTLAGLINLDGAVADVAWRQPFAAALRDGSQIQAEVALSADVLDALNINLPPGTIAGNGTGQLTIDLQRGAAPKFALRSDLRGLRVAIPAVGWSKSPQTSGELVVEGVIGRTPEITKLEISGGGLEAQGRINLAAGGGLDAAIFSRVRVGDWLNAPITLRGRGPGQPVGVEIGGGQLDLRRARFGGGQGAGGPVQIALDRLQVAEGIALTAFEGRFSAADGFTGQFNARMNGASAVRGTVAPRNGRSAVRLVSDDAGGVLRAAGFMRNATGGALDLTLLPTGAEGTFDGALAIRGIRVQDAPTMAALLDAISVVGLVQQLDGQGLSFDEVDATFRLTPRQVIVSESSAVGPGLGISLDGIYTLANKQIDVQGVVSPFFLVNSIGSFLTRKGEGLIGFNFNITGTADVPQVFVNPLSALTPGMFREIFRRPAPELNQ